jgi:hypothetical protein
LNTCREEELGMPFSITIDILTIWGSILVEGSDVVVEETLDVLATVD